MNVAVHYILLGTGDIKFLSFTNILAGATSLLTTVTLNTCSGNPRWSNGSIHVRGDCQFKFFSATQGPEMNKSPNLDHAVQKIPLVPLAPENLQFSRCTLQ